MPTSHMINHSWEEGETVKKVVILGGGIAGLSVAHELIERGFNVSVYESKTIPGGKARSIPVPYSGKEHRKDLPGEHGFRFFPGFYRHIIDTMKRIPIDRKKSVFDNLVSAGEMGIARFDKELVTFSLTTPRSIWEIKKNVKALFDTDWGLTNEEVDFFTERIWQMMTSCRERIMDEYERISWWNYLDGDHQSDHFHEVFTSITRSLVAAKAREASAKTIGTVLSQQILDLMTPPDDDDRVLNGPTNEVWIDPWVNYLKHRKVRYYTNAQTVGFQLRNGRISGVQIRVDGKDFLVSGDYYVAAMPVEVMESLVSADMVQVDPTLLGLKKLAQHVDWMNGIQFYLKRDLPILHGHLIFMDSPWALTAISQKQFWPGIDLQQYGDGKVKDILSIDISEWNIPGILFGKKAVDCSKEEIRQEVWAQLKKALNAGREILFDQDLHSWFLDPDIDFDSSGNMINKEPLLLNKVYTWHLRPNAYTGIPNFFLASDYVRTNTDLATMEAANEAARRAVNSILDASKSKAKRCRIWEMYQFKLLTPWQNHDAIRYRNGLPWNGNSSMLLKLIYLIRYSVQNSWYIYRKKFQ